MELKDVYELWERFDHSDAVELAVSLAGDSLKLRRGEKNEWGTEKNSCSRKEEFLHLSEEDVTNKRDSKKADSNRPGQGKAGAIMEGTEVKAPLIGTFYQAPSPGEAPFAPVGGKVKKGEVVGIIEAMKLMNEVLAPCDGEVVQVLAEDGSMVEYNQTLLVLK